MVAFVGTQDDYDYSEDVGSHDQDKLTRLTRLAARVPGLEKLVDDARATLAKAEAALSEVVDRAIPEIMVELGLSRFDLEATGQVIKLDKKLKASLPADPIRRGAALQWLEDHGQGGIVKRTFVIAFPKEEESWADKFERDLARRKRPLDVTRKKDVHASTLAATLREMMEDGVDVPLQTFQTFEVRRAKIEDR